MKDYIAERCKNIGTYIVETGCTVRGAADKFCVSKSTVHKDVTDRLKKVNPLLATEVKKCLDYNLDVRHIRGGEATKRKYNKI
ncbi:sporulation transcriptional regulator SpoIIID [Clostridium niameyense]|uniref:Sporulation transcriptional regulator SpoIIID n=1 Tax=Clostridium niameyense TaxID=1622073 RepID=A0A6M0RC71_9CLOT|nr:sporulation transcriptional regulator SpoIIID [Clostridium niameyense]